MKASKVSFVIVILSLIGCVAWYGLAFRIAPGVIEQAYHGRSYGLANRLIKNQKERSSEHYQRVWKKAAKFGLVSIVGLGLACLILVRPETEKLLNSWKPAPKFDPAYDVKGLGRKPIVTCMILSILMGHLYCIAFQYEFWPWSDYPMYSKVMGRTSEVIQVFGLTERGEVLLAAESYFQPFDFIRLSVAFHRLRIKDQDLSLALRTLLPLYERNRELGLHDGPVLKGLRVYQLEWDIDPDVRNLDQPRIRDSLGEVLVEQEGMK